MNSPAGPAQLRNDPAVCVHEPVDAVPVQAPDSASYEQPFPPHEPSSLFHVPQSFGLKLQPGAPVHPPILFACCEQSYMFEEQPFPAFASHVAWSAIALQLKA